MSKILIVEDETDLSQQIRDWLEREHYVVDTIEDGSLAWEQLRFVAYDVIVLDWQIPGLSGIEFCRKFRASGGKTPVMMLTARTGIDDRELGLDSGADDYLCKPFHMKELAARIRALLRRGETKVSNELCLSGLLLDPVARKVSKGDLEIHLEPKEFDLLEFFMRHPNTVFNADALLSRVWESSTDMAADSIRTYIRGLRKKLDNKAEASLITTVHGLGYRFEGS